MSLFPSQTVTVFCNYNGSVQGVHALTANDTLLYLTNDLSNFSNTNTISHTADIAFSDVDQLSTTFTSPALISTNVGVLPFCWVRSINCPTTVSNITMQQIQQLWGTGFIPASYFTGNTNDTTSIFMTGRNKDSGTRLTAAQDAFASGVPSIYQVTGGNWAKMTVNQIINGVNYGPGFTSAAAKPPPLSQQQPTVAGIGYLGLSDAKTVVTGGGSIIAYNGAYPFTGYTPAALSVRLRILLH